MNDDLAAEPRQLTCPVCGHRQRILFTDAAVRLSQGGMLRRATEVDPQTVWELAAASCHKWTCHACDHVGLTIGRVADDDTIGDWPEAKSCEGCRAIIDAVRIELFPKTKYCTACQAKLDRGEPLEDQREFCSKCGDVLRLRTSNRGASTQYIPYCPTCGR